jgi:hypothetical protein
MKGWMAATMLGAECGVPVLEDEEGLLAGTCNRKKSSWCICC